MFDQKKYVRAYNDKNYVRIVLDVRPEIKEKLLQKARKKKKSLTSFMVEKSLGV